MEFSPDDFVFHATYGVGRVSSVAIPENGPADAAEVTLAFGPENSKTFTRYLLEQSCHKIHPEGFQAYAYLDRAGAAQKIKEQPVEVILMSLQDFPGYRALSDDFKDYLGPYVEDWKAWWDKVQPLLKEDPRIDTSRTKYREYGISQTSQSPAAEKFRAFLRYKAFESPAKVYDLAKATLDMVKNGHELEDDQREILEFYMRGVPVSEKYSISDRVDALLRLKEAGWLNPQETYEQIGKLLPSFKLHQLEEYAGNRLMAYLLEKPYETTAREMLASGICGYPKMLGSLSDWALRRGDAAMISRMLEFAFAENCPPELPGERFKWLAARFIACQQLARALPANSPIWAHVLENLRNMLAAASQASMEDASFLFGPLAAFAQQTHHSLARENQAGRQALLEALLQPVFPIPFLMAVMEGVQKASAAEELYKAMDAHLWEHGEEFGFEFIRDLRKGSSPLEKAQNLAAQAFRFDIHMLREKTGEELCAMLQPHQPQDLPAFLPFLNTFAEFPGTWRWSVSLAKLRQEAYFELLTRDQTPDPAQKPLLAAVAQYVEFRSQELKKVQKISVNHLEEARAQIERLESQILEKEALIQELRSGYGSDTADARFEERTRIVKELAGSLAEFERSFSGQPEVISVVEPVMRRLMSILKGLQVSPMEEIGTRLPFNPQKHRMADPVHVDVGEAVVIFERGFLIRDFKEKLRLLKPALVKK